MESLKSKNHLFLTEFESNPKWRKIYNGLLMQNQQVELTRLVSLKLCLVDSHSDRISFNPFEKTPVLHEDSLDHRLLQQVQQPGDVRPTAPLQRTPPSNYQMVLLYDSKTKKLNWNNLDQVVGTTVRALHISNICKKSRVLAM